MKRLLIVMVIAGFAGGVLGCQASTLSSVGPDGVKLTLENYIIKESITYGAGGRITAVKKTMVPAKSVLEAAVDKVVEAMKDLIDLEDIRDDVAKNIVP